MYINVYILHDFTVIEYIFNNNDNLKRNFKYLSFDVQQYLSRFIVNDRNQFKEQLLLFHNYLGQVQL